MCKTLFDCSQTGVTGSFKPSQIPFQDRTGSDITDLFDWNRARNQQRNFETIVQIISLRSQPRDITAPELANGAWSFFFEIDTPGVFSANGDVDNLDALIDECAGIPMIVNLREHHELDPSLQPHGTKSNIWFSTVNN